MTNFTADLETELTKAKAIPFLFVGSGLSRRYIGLEDWGGLLNHFSKGLPHQFAYHRSKANGDYPAAALSLADEFFELWWSDPQYQASRNLHGNLINERSDCLKYAISDYLKANPLKVPQGLEEEVELLKQASVDGIITTNWDLFLESIFPDYEVFIGQEELLLRRPQEIAEIYKIHGCSSRPKSLVLTTNDYFDFRSKNPYLAAKLVALFVERPIIFLGYSLTDAHIRDLLLGIVTGIGSDNLQRLQDKLFFVQRDSQGQGQTIERGSMTIGHSVLPITIIRTNNFSDIYLATQGLKREFPAKMLAKLKHYVYDLASTTEPDSKIAVIDFEKVKEDSEIDVVIGVGVLKKLGMEGYTPIGREALLRDCLKEEDTYDPKEVISRVLPRLLVGNTKYVPVFKYFKSAGVAGPLGDDFVPKLREAFLVDQPSFVPQYYRRHETRVRERHTVKSLIEEYGDDCVFYIPLLPRESVERSELRAYCVDNFDRFIAGDPNHRTYFCALVCFYDYLFNR